MKKIFYYTTTAIIISCGISQAQTCVPTPTCSSLGYTSSTACDGGLKCPFGDAWNCSINEIKTEITELEKKIEDLETQKEACYIGSILYSDKSCSSNLMLGKTPIGIVVYIGGTGGGQALALKSIGNYEWGGYGTDISTLPNKTSSEAASKDYDSCGNSKKIMAAGNKSKYPAVWAANEYKTEGTSAGDWCLPAAGIFTSYYNNKSVINTGFSRAGGTKFTSGTYARSSSETGSGSAWGSYFNRSYGLSSYGKTGSGEVRPVIEF